MSIWSSLSTARTVPPADNNVVTVSTCAAVVRAFEKEGEAFVQILAAARKVKSEAQVSMKTAANTLTISGQGAGAVAELIGETAEDLKAVTSAGEIVRAETAPEGVASVVSPDERFTVSMDLIIEEKKAEG